MLGDIAGRGLLWSELSPTLGELKIQDSLSENASISSSARGRYFWMGGNADKAQTGRARKSAMLKLHFYLV